MDGRGPLTIANLVQASATAGTISLATADGRRDVVHVMLSPHVPPRIQRYDIR